MTEKKLVRDTSEILLIFLVKIFFIREVTVFPFKRQRSRLRTRVHDKNRLPLAKIGGLEINADCEIAFEIQRNPACALIRLSIIDLSQLIAY